MEHYWVEFFLQFRALPGVLEYKFFKKVFNLATNVLLQSLKIFYYHLIPWGKIRPGVAKTASPLVFAPLHYIQLTCTNTTPTRPPLKIICGAERKWVLLLN